MKNSLIFILAMLLYTTVSAQVQWTYSNTPVVAMDTTYMWASVGQPTCIIYNDTIRMWYAVASGTTPTDTVPRGRIHYAWSTDGFNWTKYAGNPVLDTGITGQWDDEWLDTPEILWDGTEFKMYYYGDSTYFQGQDNTNIGLATSSDGINWARQGIVLSKGLQNEWDGDFIESPAAYYNNVDNSYMIWYQGRDTTGWANIGGAVSPDGYAWTKFAGNPVVNTGPWLTSWDDMFVAVPSVIESDGIFEMWYSGVNFFDQWDSVYIGYALSLDGLNWVKYPGNPVLKTLAGDSANFWAVDVVWDETAALYRLYFENAYMSGASAIFPATAPRTVLFSSSCNVSAGNDTTILQGNSCTLQASGGDVYLWYPSWGLDDPTAADPVATPDSTTTYIVLVVGDSCINTDTITVTVIPAVIWRADGRESEMRIYPNPASHKAVIEFNADAGEQSDIEIYTCTGKKIRASGGITSPYTLDCDGLTKGIYILKLISEKKSVNGILMVK
ncbi:MAG: T9SS type A sorting domain-containing protein [Bacteroidota bacterium]